MIFLQMGISLEMVWFLDTRTFFLKIGHFFEIRFFSSKMGHFFENGDFFWKWGKFWKWGIFFSKMGLILKMGQKLKIWSARHMRVKYALSARESCAGIRASFRNDARASNARGYAWFSGGPNEKFNSCARRVIEVPDINPRHQ